MAQIDQSWSEARRLFEIFEGLKWLRRDRQAKAVKNCQAWFGTSANIFLLVSGPYLVPYQGSIESFADSHYAILGLRSSWFVMEIRNHFRWYYYIHEVQVIKTATAIAYLHLDA